MEGIRDTRTREQPVSCFLHARTIPYENCLVPLVRYLALDPRCRTMDADHDLFLA